MTFLDTLEASAKAATKGPWKSRKSVYGNKYRTVQFDKGPQETAMYTTSELEPADARFIAAAYPERILAIIRVVRAAKVIADAAYLHPSDGRALNEALDALPE